MFYAFVTLFLKKVIYLTYPEPFWIDMKSMFTWKDKLALQLWISDHFCLVHGDLHSGGVFFLGDRAVSLVELRG